MRFLRWLFRRRESELLKPEPLSYDERAWQRNTHPRFKHFAQ